MQQRTDVAQKVKGEDISLAPNAHNVEFLFTLQTY